MVNSTRAVHEMLINRVAVYRPQRATECNTGVPHFYSHFSPCCIPCCIRHSRRLVARSVLHGGPPTVGGGPMQRATDGFRQNAIANGSCTDASNALKWPRADRIAWPARRFVSCAAMRYTLRQRGRGLRRVAPNGNGGHQRQAPPDAQNGTQEPRGGRGGTLNGMAVNGAQNGATADMAIKRRAEVAKYRQRGMSVRGIADALAGAGTGPPYRAESGKRWSVGTIQSDLDALKAGWAVQASDDIAVLLDAENEALQLAIDHGARAVQQGVKRVIGQIEVLDDKGRVVQRVPQYEDAEDTQAIAAYVKALESRRRLLGVDKALKLQGNDGGQVSFAELMATIRAQPDVLTALIATVQNEKPEGSE